MVALARFIGQIDAFKLIEELAQIAGVPGVDLDLSGMARLFTLFADLAEALDLTGRDPERWLRCASVTLIVSTTLAFQAAAGVLRSGPAGRDRSGGTGRPSGGGDRCGR